MYSKTKTCVLNGLNGYDIDVEADLATGLQAFNIVGLPDLSVKESKKESNQQFQIVDILFHQEE